MSQIFKISQLKLQQKSVKYLCDERRKWGGRDEQSQSCDDYLGRDDQYGDRDDSCGHDETYGRGGYYGRDVEPGVDEVDLVVEGVVEEVGDH